MNAGGGHPTAPSRPTRTGSPSGRVPGTSRSSANSSSSKKIDAFLPTITRWSRWKDRKKKIDWPLFPGYCFARFNPEDVLPILKCTGVVNIVSFEGKPAPIPEIELESIRTLVGSELQYDPVSDDLTRARWSRSSTVRSAASLDD